MLAEPDGAFPVAILLGDIERVGPEGVGEGGATVAIGGARVVGHRGCVLKGWFAIDASNPGGSRDPAEFLRALGCIHGSGQWPISNVGLADQCTGTEHLACARQWQAKRKGYGGGLR